MADAVASLKAAKLDLLGQLRRIDDALLSLGVLTSTDQDTSAPKGAGLTLKSRVLAVMEEQDRVWNADQMLETLQADRFPGLNPNDPKSGIRTVFRRLVDKGLAVKKDYGKYRAAKWEPWIINGFELPPPDEYDRWEPSAEDIQEMHDEARARAFDPGEEPF